MMSNTLYERYRPHDLDGVLGQDKAVSQCRGLIERGAVAGNALWISGESGTGKTTLAKIMAATVADKWSTREVTGRTLTPAILAGFQREWSMFPITGSGHALIVNEAHGMNVSVIETLLDVLEPVPSSVVVIFTTTNAGQTELFDDHSDAGPLLSRCVKIRLTNQGLAEPFARRAAEIADLEGLNGKGYPEALKLVRACHNNLRSVLVEVGNGALKN